MNNRLLQSPRRIVSHGFRVLIALMALITFTGCTTAPPFLEPKVDENTPIEELYQNARVSLDKKQFETAVKRYTTLLSINPYGPYGEQASIDRAYAYYRLKKYDIAEVECDRIIRLYPSNKEIDYVYYLRGLTKFREQEGWWGTIRGTDDISSGNPRLIINAYNSFAEVVEKFPNSPYAVDAAQRMDYLKAALARQELNIARYYYDQGAWVAAVNRAKGIVLQFNDSSEVEPALKLLVKCYKEMGLEDLANDTQEIIDTNYPEQS